MTITCPRCGRSSVQPVTCERCLAEQWIKLCPSLYRKTDPAQLPNQAALKEILAWKYSPIGLVCGGASRRGKTRSIYLLLHRLHNEHRSMALFDCKSFEHQCAVKFYEPAIGVEWIEQLATIDVVFFDDLGKCKMTERVESEMFGVIEKRNANEVPTFATMNADSERLRGMLSEERAEPMLGRLREFSQVVSF